MYIVFKKKPVIRQRTLCIFNTLIILFTVFLLSVRPADAIMSIDRKVISVVEWMEIVEDSMSRARTFYRAVEALGRLRGEAPSPVCYFYSENKSIGEIKGILPTLFGDNQFRFLMPDWPRLAPVSWYWIEPSKDGIMISETGETGIIDKFNREKVTDPLWMIDIELPLPDASVVSSPFFTDALKRFSKIVPTLRFEGQSLVFTIFPGASSSRGLLETTYKMRRLSAGEQ